MRYTMECVDCGNTVISPDNRDPKELQGYCELLAEMSLACRKCNGMVVGRVAVEPTTQGQVQP